MKYFLTLLGCCFFSLLFAQPQDIRIFTENKDGGYIVYAANSAFCPMSLNIDLELQNLSFSEGERKIFVVPAKTEKFRLGELKVLNNAKKFKYGFRFQFVYGNTEVKQYDQDYEYYLPYRKGKSFNIWQGYNGRFSHMNENALDFSMPEGTEILAAREGVVIAVIENNTESCPRQECMKYNNIITIYHPDGTIADYGHIKYNGATVKVGDTIKKGDLIGYSGNTGWSSGPHLHYITYIPGFGTRKTIPTRFKVDGGKPAAILVEKETYTRDY